MVDLNETAIETIIFIRVATVGTKIAIVYKVSLSHLILSKGEGSLY
jgi:hypothetical protein